MGSLHIELQPTWSAKAISHLQLHVTQVYLKQYSRQQRFLLTSLHCSSDLAESLGWRTQVGADNILEHPIDPKIQQTVRACRPSSYIGFDKEVRGAGTKQCKAPSNFPHQSDLGLASVCRFLSKLQRPVLLSDCHGTGATFSCSIAPCL